MSEQTKRLGGNGFLALRLSRAIDLGLRRRTAIRDWVLAVAVVTVGQVSGLVPISWWVYAALAVIAACGLLLLTLVLPRLTLRGVLWLETFLDLLAIASTVVMVAASGGPESPYVFFFAFTVIHVATYSEPAELRATLITLACLGALAPLLYDWQTATDGPFAAMIMVAVVTWALSGALVAWKRSSAINAELAARSAAYVDPLTGAGTRLALEEYDRTSRQQGLELALCRVRAEGLGTINRTAGHLAGDAVLQRVVLAMRQASEPRDQVVRLSGADFAVLLVDSDERTAKSWATRFRERLALANAQAPNGAEAQASVGAAARGDLAEQLTSAQGAATEVFSGPRALVDAGSVSERAEQLLRQLERPQLRGATASFNGSTSPLIALPLALLAGLLIGVTGGATSALISLPILIVSWFATFGTRFEALLATGASVVAVLAAVFVVGSMTSAEQILMLSVLAVLLALTDTVGRNARLLGEAERVMAELSLEDPQTGLPNHTAFERDLSEMISAARAGGDHEQRLSGAPAVIIADIVDETALRGKLGESGEDALLIEIGALLRDAVGDEGVVYRLGGGDFGMILRAHHRQHIENLIAESNELLLRTLGGALPAVLAAAPRFRFGGAVWQEPQTAAELASAAVADQPPLDSPQGLRLA